MKKILFLLTMLLCSFTLMADFEDEPIEIQSGYCEGRGKILDREEDMPFVGITTTYSLCRINGLRYRNIGVTILGYYKNSTLSMNEGVNIAIDYDKRIIFYDPAGL